MREPMDVVPDLLPGQTSVTRDGFTTLAALLSAAELATARRHVDAVLRLPQHEGCRRPHNILLPLRWNDPVVRMTLDCARRVTRLAAAMEASDLRWISGYFSIKEESSPPLWWHQDWWCWDHPVSFRPAAAQVAVLIYLSDTSVTSGALRVLPGSHRQSHPLHALLPEAHASEATALDLTHPAMADQPEQVTLSLGAGDAVVADYRLLHGTHANQQARRDCLLLSFTPSWRDLPEEIRAHLISHPAQPFQDEGVPSERDALLLPSFDGVRRDLPLNRFAPAQFAI